MCCNGEGEKGSGDVRDEEREKGAEWREAVTARERSPTPSSQDPPSGRPLHKSHASYMVKIERTKSQSLALIDSQRSKPRELSDLVYIYIALPIFLQ